MSTPRGFDIFAEHVGALKINDEKLKKFNYDEYILPYLACYGKNMSRKKTENILEKRKAGTFFIRESLVKDHHEVSFVTEEGKVRHHLIYLSRRMPGLVMRDGLSPKHQDAIEVKNLILFFTDHPTYKKELDSVKNKPQPVTRMMARI